MINQSAQPGGDGAAVHRSSEPASGEMLRSHSAKHSLSMTAGSGAIFARRAGGRCALPGDGPMLRRSGRGLETLDCYHLAVEFATVANALVPRGHGVLKDQLGRASTSVALNLAEGWGRWQAREKAHFYTIARGSLLESGAAIDLLRARGFVDEADYCRARALCARVGQMLDGLIRAMERRSGSGRELRLVG